MRLNREARPLILSVLVILFVVLAGCKAATTGGRVGPDAVYFAPEYPTMKLESLAYLGLASVAQEPNAIPIVEDLVRSYLLGGTTWLWSFSSLPISLTRHLCGF